MFRLLIFFILFLILFYPTYKIVQEIFLWIKVKNNFDNKEKELDEIEKKKQNLKEIIEAEEEMYSEIRKKNKKIKKGLKK